MGLRTGKCLIQMIKNSAIKLEDVQVLTNNSEIIINNINLEIEKKTFNLLIGPTGSGKTTILRLIKGLIPFLLDYQVKGKVFINGELKTEKNFFHQSIDVGFVFQDFEEARQKGEGCDH